MRGSVVSGWRVQRLLVAVFLTLTLLGLSRGHNDGDFANHASYDRDDGPASDGFTVSDKAYGQQQQLQLQQQEQRRSHKEEGLSVVTASVQHDHHHQQQAPGREPKEQQHQQQQLRHLQIEGESVVCAPTNVVTKEYYETIVIRNNLREYYFNELGAVPGSCVDSCESLCNHQPCRDDYKIVRNDDCQCTRNAPFNCGPNSSCVDPERDVCQCNDGYTGSPESQVGCTDVNECTKSPNPCGVNTVCTNTDGSYTCGCAQGYFAGPGGVCTDLNECSTNVCGAFAQQCTNTDGGYSCLCKPGYTWNPVYGTGCVNLNECTVPGANACGPNAICTDLKGTYACKCRNGFVGDPPTRPCADRNECRAQPGRCGANAVCTNTPGSFKCSCKPGFRGLPPNCVGTKCTQQGIVCGKNASCDGKIGKCTCNTGYTPGPNSNVAKGGDCVDLNECQTLAAPCPSNAPICINEPGFYSCKVDLWDECLSRSDSECASGTCAKASRSETKYVCCEEAEGCSFETPDVKCCNGAYSNGEECPSRNGKDCESFKCGRRSKKSDTFVCCSSIYWPLLSAWPVCN